MTRVPKDLLVLLQNAFEAIDELKVRDELCEMAKDLYARAYEAKLKDRTPADNRPEHELVVLRNTMRICSRSGQERKSHIPFDRSELRVAVATSILHDLRFIPRVTEGDMEKVTPEEADMLRKLKAEQRLLHMREGAEYALAVLSSRPHLLTKAEVKQCVGYIGLHDLWKLGWPYPAASDWLAVCCLEGDALWPLDKQYGTLADLERKGKSNPTEEELREQAASNLKTQLCHYRANFAFSAEEFTDEETIIRTSEGARILKELREYWKI